MSVCLNESNKTKNTMATKRGEQNDETGGCEEER